MPAVRQPYLRWHHEDAPYLRRKRLRLEALLGGRCSFCGLTRDDGVELEFHHHPRRRWYDAGGNPVSPRQLSWAQRLIRYHREIVKGVLKYLACSGDNSLHCHRLADQGLLVMDEEDLEVRVSENCPF